MPAELNGADTAWIIVATALVLMMTLPGLALFYAGMVRRKNVLATMAQSVGAVALISLLWMALGYSLVFTGAGDLIGGFDRVFLMGMEINGAHPLAPTIPEALFMIYQMTFAVITCALIGGAVADRMKFSAFLLFSTFWLFGVYAPIAHWVWGGGFLGSAGVLFGWFGFNGGSALSAGPRAVYAIAATHFAACAGALAWTALEWWERKKPSVLGMISGAVAGLGAITGASGYVMPQHGALIGLIAGALCYWACIRLKTKLKYDDSLDVFGVHGVGGILGTFMAGVLATGAVSATASSPEGLRGLIDGNAAQVGVQVFAIVVTVGWTIVGTWAALKVVQKVTGLRVNSDQEREGLDLTLHGETIHQ